MSKLVPEFCGKCNHAHCSCKKITPSQMKLTAIDLNTMQNGRLPKTDHNLFPNARNAMLIRIESSFSRMHLKVVFSIAYLHAWIKGRVGWKKRFMGSIYVSDNAQHLLKLVFDTYRSLRITKILTHTGSNNWIVSQILGKNAGFCRLWSKGQ